MNKDKCIQIWKLHDQEYLEFFKIKNKICESPDLSALMLIHKFMLYKEYDVIRGSEHDEIYLTSLDDLDLEKITEDVIIDLIRCGVRYDENYDCLSMFI